MGSRPRCWCWRSRCYWPPWRPRLWLALPLGTAKRPCPAPAPGRPRRPRCRRRCWRRASRRRRRTCRTRCQRRRRQKRERATTSPSCQGPPGGPRRSPCSSWSGRGAGPPPAPHRPAARTQGPPGHTSPRPCPLVRGLTTRTLLAALACSLARRDPLALCVSRGYGGGRKLASCSGPRRPHPACLCIGWCVCVGMGECGLLLAGWLGIALVRR